MRSSTSLDETGTKFPDDDYEEFVEIADEDEELWISSGEDDEDEELCISGGDDEDEEICFSG